MKIPLCIPYINELEMSTVQEVLKSGWFVHGPQNEKFEGKFAEYIGTKHAISLNSCTSALQLALQAQGITGEVIVPSFTFVASANAIVTAGAKPVFVDVKYDTCNIDPSAIESTITDKTEAIMPVHFGGQSCEMNEIFKIAEKHKLTIIEDSAETIGGLYKGKKTGAFGSTGCFSFFPTKNMTTGEGGMLTTNDDAIARKVRIISAHGVQKNLNSYEKKPWIRDAVYAGYNFRMSNILAAIGVHQVDKLEEMNNLRRQHAAYLKEKLSNFDWIDLPVEMDECKHVYQMFTIKIKNGLRDKLFFELQKQGIGVSVHFDPPVHRQQYYERFFDGAKYNLPITDKLANSILTLPMYPQLTERELDNIVKAFSKFLN